MSKPTGNKPATPRVPPAFLGIDINHCKTPGCPNFGVQIPPTAARGPGAQNPYTVVANGKDTPAARCNLCGETFTLKSNVGVAEEGFRILSETFPVEACPDPLCGNHRTPTHWKGAYQSIGTTEIGSRRFRCKCCGRTFSVKPKGLNPIARQRQSDKNRTILSALTNKVPMRRICEMADVSPRVLYERIDFFHEQVLAFLADRESRMGEVGVERLYVGVDRQEYVVNWSRREDKKNVVVSACAAADNTTGYVLAMNTNFDPGPDRSDVERASAAAGDRLVPAPHRRFARLWLEADFINSTLSSKTRPPVVLPPSDGSLNSSIERRYAVAFHNDDPEAGEAPAMEDTLPGTGMLVHSEYTLYGHFLALRHRLGSVGKVRFFLDQDSGIRGACLGVFADMILENRCDAFYVSIAKELTVDEKRLRLKEAKEAFDELAKTLVEEMKSQGKVMTKDDVVLALLKDRIASARALGPWRDRWVAHPLPSMSEPEKALCHLTDFGQYAGDEDHLAWLFNKASLHAVDSFFNRLRRRFSMLERPVSSAANRGRVWNGYSAYRPEQIAKLLTIARVCHNFVWTPDPRRGVAPETPAMRLGLARAPLDLNDIIYFKA